MLGYFFLQSGTLFPLYPNVLSLYHCKQPVSGYIPYHGTLIFVTATALVYYFQAVILFPPCIRIYPVSRPEAFRRPPAPITLMSSLHYLLSFRPFVPFCIRPSISMCLCPRLVINCDLVKYQPFFCSIVVNMMATL